MSNPVRLFLDHLGADGLPEALELVAEDAVFSPEGPVDLPIYGQFYGKAGAERLFTTLAELFETELFEIIDWAEAGDTVFARGNMRHRVRRSGAIIESGFALVVTIAQGKITRWRIYENSAAFQSALA